MAVLFTSWWIEFFFVLFVCLFFYYIHFKLIGSKYWKNRNVFQVDPVFLLGNNWKMLFTENIGFVHEKRYREWKHKKLIGYWSFVSPAVLVTDVDLIKKIMVRDFNYFRDRSININEKRDPLAGHLVNLTGAKWRNIRVKLTPTFTSGRMKLMFPIMVECGLQTQNFLSKHAKNGDVIEFKEIFARFTTDIISSCAFGIESNSINNPDSEFRNYGRKIFEPGFLFVVRFILTSFFPTIRDLLGMRSIPKDVSDFFLNIVKETMEFRELNNVKRNDFMDLLIQLKNKGRLDDVDNSSKNESEDVTDDKKFTLNEAAAQAFVFFAAGFETSSTTLSFAIYELAVNPDIQTRLQKEIDTVMEKYNNKLTYDGIMEMDYLDRVIHETLRKYPPLTILGRKCTADYEIPEMGVRLEKDTRVIISLLGLHRDPDFFPKPEVFDPDRFSQEEKSKRDHLASMPFGEGPRNCIGTRFGLLQTKVGLVSVMSQFTVEVSKETPIPLEFNKKAFILTPLTGVPLRIVKRK